MVYSQERMSSDNIVCDMENRAHVSPVVLGHSLSLKIRAFRGVASARIGETAFIDNS